MFTVDLNHFAARILQDALQEATADYWERRAQQFEDAAPRSGDWHGAAPPGELVDQAIRCRETAQNCRRHAHLIRQEQSEGYAAEVEDALG